MIPIIRIDFHASLSPSLWPLSNISIKMVDGILNLEEEREQVYFIDTVSEGAFHTTLANIKESCYQDIGFTMESGASLYR